MSEKAQSRTQHSLSQLPLGVIIIVGVICLNPD
jgi:hypothetical protein